jgi:hypothetical protein
MDTAFTSSVQSATKEGTTMQRTSLRTLVLMLELFTAVASLQYLAEIRPAKASAVWLAGDGTTSPTTPAHDANDAINT